MKIYLRPITLDDGSKIVKWRNSPNVMNHCFDKTKITVESNTTFFNNYVKTGKYQQFIVERIDEDYEFVSYPIATVYLKDIDLINKRCELCVFTSDDEEWNADSQIIAIKMLLSEAFNNMGIHKIYSYVYAFNKDEYELLKKAGFVEEALLKKEAINNRGDYSDVYRMCISNEVDKK